jgi:hypothetical protein
MRTTAVTQRSNGQAPYSTSTAPIAEPHLVPVDKLVDECGDVLWALVLHVQVVGVLRSRHRARSVASRVSVMRCTAAAGHATQVLTSMSGTGTLGQH